MSYFKKYLSDLALTLSFFCRQIPSNDPKDVEVIFTGTVTVGKQDYLNQESVISYSVKQHYDVFCLHVFLAMYISFDI